MIIFAGRAFGVIYVVLSPRPGVKVTIGGLATLAKLREGQHVAIGEPLGIAGFQTYLGVRVGDEPHDPMAYLARRGAILVGNGYNSGKSLACNTAY
jgi:hypothetical protein